MQARDKVFVVTGAGSGIGRELALLLLSKGASVADLRGEAMEALVAAHAGRFAPFVCDVSQRSAVEALPERILARFAAIDCVINNAGIIQPFVRLKTTTFLAMAKLYRN